MKLSIARHRTTIQRLCWLFAILNLMLLVTGCTTAWTSEASNIITLLVPAIASALSILAAFGVGLSPTAMSSIQAWAKQATDSLATVKSLIDQYNAAEATAKPGLLTEIETVIATITNNLAELEPQLHITDPSTQAKISAVIGAIQAELNSLLNLIPVIQGQPLAAEEMHARIKTLKTASQFKADFNAKVAALGPEAKQYQLR